MAENERLRFQSQAVITWGGGVKGGEKIKKNGDVTLTQHQRVVDDSSDAVRGEDDHRPRLIHHQMHQQELTGYHAQHDPFEVGIVAE